MGTISSNNIIVINRGDSFIFTHKLNLGSAMYPEYYELKDNDKVYLGVTECNKPFEQAIIKQVYDKQDQDTGLDVTFKFKPDDTLYLLPGRYYYEIKLSTDNGSNVYTILPKTILYIVE